MSRTRRQHLDAGPHLHPMTVIDIFYYILDYHSDVIDTWDRSHHQLWCTCGEAPQAYVHPTHQRPILCRAPLPPEDDAEDEPDRQLELPLGDDDLVADEDIPF